MVSYSKLEVNGEWNSHSNEPTEVLITFGSISLNILDKRGEPLRQWAYSSIFLKTRETSKSMFCPDMEETESLYIFDQDAVNQLIFLCNKTKRRKITNLFPWFFLFILLIFSSVYFSDYFRKVTEKVAASLTSDEQESNLGNMMFSEISGVSHCDIKKVNDYIHSSDKNYLSTASRNIELIFINLKKDSSILFPGGKLLVPYSILEEKDGVFKLVEITKEAKKAIKNKKAISKFFSDQTNKSLLIYIFGNFTHLNFDKDNGFSISLDGRPEAFDKGFTNKKWLKLKKICKL